MSRVGASAANLRTVPLHEFLLPAALVLGPYLGLMAHPAVVVRPLLVAMALSAVVFAAASFVSGGAKRGAFVVTGLWLVLVSKPIIDAVVVLASGQPAVALVLVSATALVVLLGVRIAIRRRLTATTLTRWLNLSSALLLIIVVLSSIPHGFPTALVKDVIGPRPAGPRHEGDPDIYVVLLDAYPGRETLERVFHHGNDAFLDSLESRGVEVVEDSRSNYWFTSLTLGSLFHMEPLDDVAAFADVIEGRIAPKPQWRQAINNAPAFSMLRERGYRVTAVAPGWADVTIRSADVFIDGGQLSDFEVQLMRTTYMADLLELIDPAFFISQQRQRIDSVFDAVVAQSADPGDRPRFTFAHVPAPHPPLAVSADGATTAWPDADSFYGITTDQMGLTVDEFDQRFVEQLLYVNRRTVEIVDAIIEADDDAVIVVMSDHGPGNPGDSGSVTGIDVPARLGNLMAIRDPSGRATLPDGSTPVNLLPRLFNAYFDLDLPYHADTSYRSTVFGTDEMFEAIEPIPSGQLDR